MSTQSFLVTEVHQITTGVRERKEEKRNKDRKRRPRADSIDRGKKRGDFDRSIGEGDFVIWGYLRTLRRDQSHVLWTQW